MLLRPAQQNSRVAKVVIHHKAAVCLHRVGAGPLMHDRRHTEGIHGRCDLPRLGGL